MMAAARPADGGLDRLGRRWPSAAPFVLAAGPAILAGGLISAATAYAPSYLASWAVAYLVLVVGVAQLVLGAGRSFLPDEPPPAASARREAVAFNLGNAAVLAGSLLGRAWLTSIGAALLVVVLVALGRAGRPARRRCGFALAYRAMLAILTVSVPIGVWLAWAG